MVSSPSQQAGATNGASLSSGPEKLDLLVRLTETDMKEISFEEALRWCTIEGPSAPGRNPPDGIQSGSGRKTRLIAAFIETRGVAVNTITPGEHAIVETTHIGLVKKSLFCTPLMAALSIDTEEVANYLLARVKKEEVETTDTHGCTCLMLAAKRNNVRAVRHLRLGADTQTV